MNPRRFCLGNVNSTSHWDHKVRRLRFLPSGTCRDSQAFIPGAASVLPDCGLTTTEHRYPDAAFPRREAVRRFPSCDFRLRWRSGPLMSEIAIGDYNARLLLRGE